MNWKKYKTKKWPWGAPPACIHVNQAPGMAQVQGFTYVRRIADKPEKYATSKSDDRVPMARLS